MRFLMVTTFYPPHHFGGDATYVRQLSSGLRDKGHKVDVVYCYDAYRISGGDIGRHTDDDAGDIDRDGYGDDDSSGSVRKLTSRFGPLSPLYTQLTGRPGIKHSKLQKIFDRPYDVVHFHNISLIGGPGILSMSKAPLTLFTAHEHWTVCPMHIFWKNRSKPCDKRACFSCQIRSGRPPQLWRYTKLLKSSFEKVDLVFAPSQFTQRALQAGGIERPNIVLKLFAPSAFDTLVANEGTSARPSFLYVGRVTHSKGVGPLTDLFLKRPEYDLKIVGQGDVLSALRRKCAGADNIAFLGKQLQSELPTLYRRATAVILPSLAPETFGLATIEGFSQGTPAIVRDSGGAGETIRETGAGIVFKTDNEALVALDSLAKNRTYRDKLGALARQAYLDRYTERRHIDTYLSHIDNFIKPCRA